MIDLRHMLPGEVREHEDKRIVAARPPNVYASCHLCMFNDVATRPCPVAKSTLDCMQSNQKLLGSVFFMEEDEYLKARLKGLV